MNKIDSFELETANKENEDFNPDECIYLVMFDTVYGEDRALQ